MNDQNKNSKDSFQSSELKDREKIKKVYKTSDVGKGFQSVKGCVPFLAVNKLYAKINVEYRFERWFWLVAKLLLPLLIFVLFLTSVIGIALNFGNISTKVVRFASSNTSQNIIEIPINMHEWASRCNKEHFITKTESNRYILNFSKALTKSTTKMWNDFSYQFDDLTTKIEKIGKNHNVNVTREKNSKFKKRDFPPTFQKILNKGIDFYALQMKYYAPVPSFAHHNSDSEPSFYDNLYVIPLAFRNNIDDKALLLPTPTLILNIDSYFKYYSGNSDFIIAFKNDVKALMQKIAKNKDSVLNTNCFGNGNFINTRTSPVSNITSILPVFNISQTTHNQSISYFKNSMIAILIIFVILLIYLLFRYGVNNVLTIFCAGTGLLLFLFPILTIIVPIALSAYTILILIILLFLFNAGFFIHQAAAHIKAYEKDSRFVFAKKNDIKKIAFDILIRMKKILLLQLVAFAGLGIMLAVGYALPFFQTGLVHELIGYGITLCLATIAMVILFVFGFVFVWINATYYYLNIKKTQIINAILYHSAINNEQEIVDINDFWAEINIKRLIYLNPEVKSIINVDYDIIQDNHDANAIIHSKAGDTQKSDAGENSESTLVESSTSEEKSVFVNKEVDQVTNQHANSTTDPIHNVDHHHVEIVNKGDDASTADTNQIKKNQPQHHVLIARKIDKPKRKGTKLATVKKTKE